jgi:hypothetical protein
LPHVFVSLGTVEATGSRGWKGRRMIPRPIYG